MYTYESSLTATDRTNNQTEEWSYISFSNIEGHRRTKVSKLIDRMKIAVENDKTKLEFYDRNVSKPPSKRKPKIKQLIKKSESRRLMLFI